MKVRLKTERDLTGLRESGKILSFILESLRKEIKEGTALNFFDELARKLLKETGAEPVFLGYKSESARRPFPAAICTSVNEQIVHGIPSDYILKNGDILKIDFAVNYKGYITDAAFTAGIGEINGTAKKLIDATKEALARAIVECCPGNHLGDIGWAIEQTAADAGFKVASGLTGHGVGFALHEEPNVYNYGKRGEGMKLAPGLVLAIEPMTSLGSPAVKQNADDSFSTKDKSLSAHFEKTVAVTANGPEVLTGFE